jgi:(p)ppGpp synthase/HD superfamily hydrolase
MSLSTHFDEALVYASGLHRAQLRKGTRIPYVSHLLAVTAIVLERGGDEETAIAALLHDAAEDCGGTPVLEEIRRRFGERVATLVAGCTDDTPLPGAAKAPWRPRKEAYLAHLPHAADAVRLISAADKLHNARSTLTALQHGEDVWSRFAGGREGTLWYYHRLIEIFRTAGPHDLGEELARTVAEIEAIKKTS